MSSATIPNPPLTDSEIRELIRRSQRGDLEAREKVVLTYIPLAKSCAQKYVGYGVPLDDLMQEAYYGLLVALIHYDTSRDAAFSTFSRYYITKYIRLNALMKQNSNLPSCYDYDFYQEIKRYINAVEKFKTEKERSPNDQEMADILNISLWRIQRIRRASYTFMAPSIDIDEIAKSYGGSKTHRSLEDEVLSRFELQELRAILTPREAEVIERRCGFAESGEPETWPYISAAMGYSLGTVQRNYREGIGKLRKALGVTSADTKSPDPENEK